MQKIFVTGSSGFIGSRLIHEAVRRGIHCKCLVRPTSKVNLLPEEGVELVEGRIEDRTTYQDALVECETVIHLAGLISALNKDSLFSVNAKASGELADACLAADRPPRLVYVSSLAAAGPPGEGKTVRTEQDQPRPVSAYGESKRLGERLLAERADRLSITIVRPGVVYGPGDPKFLEMIEVIHKWRWHVVVGWRTPPLSLIHVDDLVELIFLAVERGERLTTDPDSAQGVYFACDDAEFPTYTEFGRRVAKSLEVSVRILPLWRWVARTVAFTAESAARWRGRPSVLTLDKIREATVSSWASSGKKSREQLGFEPSKSLDEHLQSTSRWYVDNGWL